MFRKKIKFMKVEEIIMTNQRNMGFAIGRLTADPTTFTNRDGSTKFKFTLAVNDNFKNGDGTPSVQMINFEAFRAKDAGLGAFASLEKGDKIGVEYSVRQNNYEREPKAHEAGVVNANGKVPVYDQILFVSNIDFMETVNEKNARKGRKATSDATATAVANAANAAPEVPVEFNIPM